MYLERLSQPIQGPPPVQVGQTPPNHPVKQRSLASLVADRAQTPLGSRPPIQGEKSAMHLKSVRPLLVWSYSDSLDTCAICRGKLAAPCHDCTSPLESACLVRWGTCKHGYHAHCIDRWVEQRAVCPQCQQAWLVYSSENPLGGEVNAG